MGDRSVKRIVRICLIFFMMAGLALPAFGRDAGSSSLPIRRFALIAGSNDGGKNRVKLRYATADALAFAEVMHEMGGIGEKDRCQEPR